MSILNLFAPIGQFVLDYPLIVIAVLLVMNVIALILYARDKKKAKEGKWRTPEATLITSAWLFGSIGALIGMYGFRHKTKHAKFVILVPLAFVIQLAFFAVSIVAALR